MWAASAAPRACDIQRLTREHTRGSGSLAGAGPKVAASSPLRGNHRGQAFRRQRPSEPCSPDGSVATSRKGRAGGQGAGPHGRWPRGAVPGHAAGGTGSSASSPPRVWVPFSQPPGGAGGGRAPEGVGWRAWGPPGRRAYPTTPRCSPRRGGFSTGGHQAGRCHSLLARRGLRGHLLGPPQLAMAPVWRPGGGSAGSAPRSLSLRAGPVCDGRESHYF